jgi:parvulin-like peptidyl-prolyl isomerase
MKRTLITLALAGAMAVLAAAGNVTAVLNDVYTAYARKDFAGAQKLLETALAGATDAGARLALGLELGDFYLDKQPDYRKAESIYTALIAQYPNAKDIGDVVYRLGVVQERQEKYLDAAQNYERVAIKYQGSTFSEDGLNAIERCFRKNYQDRAALVDSYPITRLEFDDMVSRSPSQYEKFPDKLKLLNQMIDDRLMFAAANRQGLAREPEFVAQLSDFRRDMMMQTWYDREVVKKVTVDDSMKRNYYAANRNTYITPEQVKAREILVKTKLTADSLYNLLVTGKLAFETLAKANSTAPDKDQGGNMGWFRRKVRTPEVVDTVAFGLKVGEISKPFKAGDNFMILKLEDRRERKDRSYDEVSSEIEGILKPRRTQARFQKLLEDMKKEHVVADTSALAKGKDTLALVDGMPVRQADLSVMMERIPPMYRAQFESPEGKQRVLDQLLTERVVMRQAEQNKYWLASDVIGSTLERERSLLTSTLKKREVTDKVKLDEKEIQADYKKTIKDFKVAEQVRAKEIVLKSRPEAEALRKQLTDTKHPVSFDSLARAVSAAPTRWAAGDMGMVSKGQKPKAIEKVLFGLSPKSISGVIKLTDTTFALYKVDEHRKAYTRPLSEVRPKIERKLRTEVEKQAEEQYKAGLREKAQIEIYLTEANTAPPPLESLPPMVEDTGAVPVITQEPIETPATRAVPAEILPQSVLASVYFDFDKVSVRAKYRAVLDSLALLLKSQSGGILVAGYCDKGGADDYNTALALRRANRVKDLLVKAGIEAARIEVKSLGKKEARAEARGDRWKDRRVDVIAK